MTLTAGELFAGYGGLAMSVEEVFGAETRWVAEFDAAPSKILAHRFPGVPNLHDVTQVDWTQVEPVDIISGGSPCQDVSQAGRRKGMTEGTRSNLWVSMREAIATIQPRYVVWENVRGAYSAKAHSEMEPCPGCLGGHEGRDEPVLRALGRVLGDLSQLGYDAQWRGLRAADVGAPHGRYRVFVLARLATDTECDGLQKRGLPRRPSPELAAPVRGLSLFPTPSANIGTNGGSQHPDKRRAGGHQPSIQDVLEHTTDWGTYGAAIRRWEAVTGQEAPAPTGPTPRAGKRRLNPMFVEWMMGLPPGWVTDMPISRNDQLKALGNGVVPQQCTAALEDMLASFGAPSVSHVA